jgi:hypothetical protein
MGFKDLKNREAVEAMILLPHKQVLYAGHL